MSDDPNSVWLLWGQGRWYERLQSVYEPTDDTAVYRRVVRWLGDTNQAHTRGKALLITDHVVALLKGVGAVTQDSWLRGLAGDETPRSTAPHMQLANGILRLDNRELVPKSPKFFSTSEVSYPYEAGATCPLWERSVALWLQDDQEAIQFLQEYIGYLLTPDTSQHVGLFLQGSGANGKSVCCDLITSLLGRERVSSVSLHQLAEGFCLASCHGKLANISTETERNSRIPVGVLKAIISGDTILVNRKYHQPFPAKATARLIVAWNDPPTIEDRTDAFWRRFRLLRFNRRFTDQEKDVRLGEKLHGELSGILNWALDGLDRLTRVGYFTLPESSREASSEFRRTSDPIRAFTEDHCRIGKAFSCPKDPLYSAYVHWAVENSLEPESKIAFFKHLKDIWGVTSTRVRGGKGHQGDQSKRFRVVEGIEMATATPTINQQELSE